MDDYRKYYGFCANVKNGRIVGFDDLMYDNIDNVPEGTLFEFVYCEDCDCYMDRKPKSWKCPKCGRMIRWSTVMDALADDTKRTAIDEDNDYEDYY